MTRRHTHGNAAKPGQADTIDAPIEKPAESDAIRLLEQERNELKEQLLRTVADMQNLRKRVHQEMAQVRQFATEELVRELLPALDNFERTIGSGEQGADVQVLLEGVKAVDRQLRAALERRNVSRIKSQGEQFDPGLHEAIATDDAEDLPDGTVTSEVEAGYKMADRVIRPARVRVSRKA